MSSDHPISDLVRIRIGLLEAPHFIIHAAGNTALRGAKMLFLADREPALPPIEDVSLAAESGFQNEFANCMLFLDQRQLEFN